MLQISATTTTTHPELATPLARCLAIFFTVYGASLLIWPKRWLSVWAHMLQGPEPGFSRAAGPLVMGAMVVAMHNIWEFSPRLAITIFGWLALAKAVVSFLAPDDADRRMRLWIQRGDGVLIAGAFIALVLAGFAAWEGFFMDPWIDPNTPTRSTSP